MPGIVVFNRRWVVGSDDFVIPFGIAFVLRVIWYVKLRRSKCAIILMISGNELQISCCCVVRDVLNKFRCKYSIMLSMFEPVIN